MHVECCSGTEIVVFKGHVNFWIDITNLAFIVLMPIYTRTSSVQGKHNLKRKMLKNQNGFN